ncbi:MAG: hypothetical protein R3A79_21100 [Nannocystaceae bacterium]
MPVKSWISGPGAEGRAVLAGPVTFYGVVPPASAGVASVEVSVDGGERWTPATLSGPDLGADAWRAFTCRVELAPGTYRVVSRATDAAGETQPGERVDNERGHGNNARGATWPRRRPPSPSPGERGRRADAADADEGKRARRARRPARAAALRRCRAPLRRLPPPRRRPHQHDDRLDLDALRPERARVVNASSRRRRDAAVQGRLTPSQLQDLATYVFEATR